MRRWVGIAALTAACTPGEPDDALLLATDGAAGIRVDDGVVDARFPMVLPTGALVTTDGDGVEAGPSELLVVVGDAVAIYVPGVDVAPDLVAVEGEDASVTALAEELGLELEGEILWDPDVWAILADASPVAGLRFRPVADVDLPGTVPPGGRAAITAPELRAGAGWLTVLLSGGPDPAQRPDRDAMLARARAASVFALPDGDAPLSPRPSSDGAAMAAMVGRYCDGDDTLTLSASGTARLCAGEQCGTAPWTVVGGEVRTGGLRWTTQRSGDGWMLAGDSALTDLIVGGCR